MAGALAACLALSGCGDGSDGKEGASGKDGQNGKDGTNGAPGTSMLVRMVDEPAGTNCASGGQKLQLGTDVNANSELDDGEVQETRYVCNGNSIVGPQGPQGPQGFQGPAAIGQFALDQMVKGRHFTCDSVTMTANASKCAEPKVHGLYILDLRNRATGGGLSTFCAAVTGNDDKSPQLVGTDIYEPHDTYFAWDNNDWRIASHQFYSFNRLVSISCAIPKPK